MELRESDRQVQEAAPGIQAVARTWARLRAVDRQVLRTLARSGAATDAGVILQKARKAAQRRAREQTLRDLGLTKVRGALGGVYWE